jgi:hypothetical protein
VKPNMVLISHAAVLTNGHMAAAAVVGMVAYFSSQAMILTASVQVLAQWHAFVRCLYAQGQACCDRCIGSLQLPVQDTIVICHGCK